jgi:NitT/TauT family transport system substrate-binding protein
MALRWLKPLEQGFDVRITAGIHGGCLRLLGARAAGIGRVLAPLDLAVGVDAGLDQQQCEEVLGRARLIADRDGPLADADPRTFLWLKDPRLTEVATNLSGEFATRSCPRGRGRCRP